MEIRGSASTDTRVLDVLDMGLDLIKNTPNLQKNPEFIKAFVDEVLAQHASGELFPVQK